MKVDFIKDSYFYMLTIRSKDIDTVLVETDITVKLHNLVQQYHHRINISGILFIDDDMGELMQTVVRETTNAYIQDCERARLIVVDKEYLEYAKSINNLS